MGVEHSGASHSAWDEALRRRWSATGKALHNEESALRRALQRTGALREVWSALRTAERSGRSAPEDIERSGELKTHRNTMWSITGPLPGGPKIYRAGGTEVNSTGLVRERYLHFYSPTPLCLL